MPDGIVRQRLVEVLNKIISQKALEEAGRYGVYLINQRVHAGHDLNNNPFMQYSAKYRARKIKNGKWSGSVDLQLSGRMIRDLNTNITRNFSSQLYEVEIGYIPGKSSERSIQKARWHNIDGAGRKKVKRTFVGLTDIERRKILEFFQGRN